VKTFAKRCAWWFGYGLAIIIILAATFVSLSRMMTPYLNDHRHDFEQWASEELHAPITIRRVHITWYYYQPVLTFDNVAILDVKTAKPNFQVQQIKVNLQILPSLLHWQPRPNYIKIFGANLILREQPSGQMSIEGVHPLAVINTLQGSGVQANAALTWILSQPHLVLDDINIRYIPLHDTEKSITLDRLSLVNTGASHELAGNAILNQATPLDVQLRIEVTGDIAHPEHLSADGYFYLEGVSLPQWIKQNKWQNLQITQGLGSAKIWVTWEQAQLKAIRTELQFYDLQVKSLATKKTLTISRLNGKFGWSQAGDQQIIYGQDVLIDFPENLWPTTGFSVTLNHLADGAFAIKALKIDYIDLADTIEMALASGIVPVEKIKVLNQLDLAGGIHALNIQFSEPLTHFDENMDFSHAIFSVEFSNLSCNAWQQLPKVSNLTGLFSWDAEQANLKLNSEKAVLDLTSLFTSPLLFDQLAGEFTVSRDKQGGYLLTGKDLALANRDLTANANFSLAVPQNAAPTIDLTANFTMTDVTPITKYFPSKILDPALDHWLQNTFYGGKIPAGNIVLQGRLSDFPFDKNNGKFKVSADVADLDFEFAPKWPGIKHLNGQLIFSGHLMTVDVASGQMLTIPLKNLHAEIPYIGPDQPQILNIRNTIAVDLKDALQYVQQSPLQKTIGKSLSAMNLVGPMQLDLQLTIPLKNPDKTLVVGDMSIPSAELTLPEWNIKIEDLSGGIHFTDDDIKSTNLQGKLFGDLIALNIDSVHTPNAPSTVVAKFQSKISKAILQNWLKFPAMDIIKGATSYTAQLNLTSDKQSKPSELIITSDLLGIDIDLPDIYGKKAVDLRKFELAIVMDKQDQGPGIKLTYGDAISAAVTLHNEQGKSTFYSGELRLGRGAAVFQSKPGLLISGQFEHWDLATWQGYLASLTANHSSTVAKSQQKANFPAYDIKLLRGVDLVAQQFSAYGLDLHAAHLQVLQNNLTWLINVKSNEMSGEVVVPSNFKKPIQAKFQHLYLAPMSGAPSRIEPKTLPAISFTGADVRYKNMSFGSVMFNSVPTGSGLSIQSLRASSPFYTLNAKGEWRSQKNSAKTYFQGVLETKDVGKLLNIWGFNASNLVESGGNAQFDLNWNGVPYSPELNSMLGDLTLKFTAGRIIDLSNSTDAKMGIGKMLNIFNLSTLPRRLSLNFKDFKNGYSFDSMKGNFTLKTGSVFTQDTVFDGPIARIAIKGRIGIVAKDYDVDFSVTPYGMTSSLPLVATVVGGPVAGAATWLVDKVVGGAVSNVITHRYSVRGPWGQPVWSEK
jgi:uncharacterized protein (TIGR02099 family)